MAATTDPHQTPPPFTSLPLDSTGPPGNAWGRFGPTDELGTLNLLTPSVVAWAAAKEIRTGIRISLDWPLSVPSFPSFDRKPFRQEIVQKWGNMVNDDVLHFNTQGSSQWDGLRHYGNHETKEFYMGHKIDEFKDSDVLGEHVVCDNGGIVGRGVLLDYKEWAESQGIKVEALQSKDITLDNLKSIIKQHNIQFRQGDILFIRSGFTAAYNELNFEEQKKLPQREQPDFVGVQACEEVVRWIWDCQFAAVAGDAPSFERAPFRGAHADLRWNLHDWLLAGWGMPIGEMFDLEKLSKHCKETGRYTFFLSSMPLKVIGGVASPPNAVAIF